MSDKKSFVLYNDYWDVFEVLNREERGDLLEAIYRYVLYNEEMENLPDKALVAFKMVRRNLVRDIAKYEKVCEKRSEAGKLSVEVKKQRLADGIQNNRTSTNANTCSLESTNANTCSKTPTKSTDSDSVSDTETDSVSVSVSVSDSVTDSELPTGALRRSRYIETAKKVVCYLNKKADTTYSYDMENTLGYIKARMEEGFSEGDFIKVIDKKVGEWKGTSYERYLRPATLFGTKFEGYLNQKCNKTDYYVAPGENDILPF